MSRLAGVGVRDDELAGKSRGRKEMLLLLSCCGATGCGMWEAREGADARPHVKRGEDKQDIIPLDLLDLGRHDMSRFV